MRDCILFGWAAARRRRREGKAASRRRDWAAAAEAYGAFVRLRPTNARVWVQLGHALKEQGFFADARVAYDRAVALKPKSANAWLQLGHILKLQGERSAAVDAYARSAALDPNLKSASDELIALGQRDRLPQPAAGHAHDALRSAIYPPSRYDAFRRQLDMPRAPRDEGDVLDVHVVIDAREALTANVRATLVSLVDQVDGTWSATVLAPAPMRNHSVASFACLDERISFVDPEEHSLPLAARHVLLVDAGVVLHQHALEWFCYAARRSDCVAAYGDHDHAVDHWREGRRFESPMFQPMFDPEWFADDESTPVVLWVDRARLPVLSGRASADVRRRLILAAAAIGGVAHIPLLLATVKGLAPEAENAMADRGAVGRPPASRTVEARPVEAASPPAKIQVIIQTRDEPKLLADCVASLRKLAAHPDLVDICIVDNRSVLSATARLLRRLRAAGATILTLDEPFNWARANNLAVEGGTAPLLLFLNNDTQMLTPGWDDVLRDALADPDVGMVGALLLYPDRTIQHAGMILGMGAGQPTHEGVGRAGDDPGPNGRWSRPRGASAITGALMALRREVFAEMGGFDAMTFSIAFNDIDLCLRVRAAGLRIVLTPRIKLIHYESKTRGMNVTRSQIAWDLEELAALRERWGAAMFDDPGYNPHWTRVGQPFDGYRFPELREVVRHIDRSARPQPWRILSEDHSEDVA